MKKFFAPLAVAAAFFAACGDTVENTAVNQTGMEVVASAEELPECTDETAGDQAYVKGESAARICVDGEWLASVGGKDTVLVAGGRDTVVVAGDTVYLGGGDFSCTTEELADKSGLKIVCNGDSIGVVLNGAKGDKGETGNKGEEGSGCTISQDNASVTVTCGDSTTTIKLITEKPAAVTSVTDSSDAAVSLDSLAGYSQKGPFLKGSSVYLYELDNGKSLKQTNGNFTSYITNDDGYYKFTSRNVNPYALIIVDGNYRNEVTGKVSNQTIRLKALSDVRKHHKGANVNILTHLEYERVYFLVTKKGLDFDDAKQTAQEEIFRAFDMIVESNKDAETLNIFGKTDADAALLALSILLQGDRSEAEMMAVLTEISNDLAQDGTWNDSLMKTKVADWALLVESENKLEKFRENVKKWRFGDDTVVPDFEKFVRNYVNIESMLGACAEGNVGEFAHVPNPSSKYFAEDYSSIDASKNSLVRVICDSEGGYHWRFATALERDTKGWEAKEDGTLQKGQIDTSLVYVYDAGWRHGTELDLLIGSGCTEARKGVLVLGEDNVSYICADVPKMTYENTIWTVGWRVATGAERDFAYLESEKNENGTLLTGPVTGNVVVWDAGAFRAANEEEIEFGRGCVSYILGESDTLGLHSSYTCRTNGWSFDSVNVITDPRDKHVYKTIKIGSLYWMAQNLNYTYDIVQSDVFSGMERHNVLSKCHKGTSNKDSCALFGQFYPWSAAMDSAALFSDDGRLCGNERSCMPAKRVRGVCPVGWRLPERVDWEWLVVAVGGYSEAGRKIKSTNGWNTSSYNGQDPNGTDAYGFNAKPYTYSSTSFDTEFWSATEYNLTHSFSVGLSSYSYGMSSGFAEKTRSYAIRCVKD